jgi:hypothetical protein
MNMVSLPVNLQNSVIPREGVESGGGGFTKENAWE